MNRKKKSRKVKTEEDIIKKLETQTKALRKILTKIKPGNKHSENM